MLNRLKQWYIEPLTPETNLSVLELVSTTDKMDGVMTDVGLRPAMFPCSEEDLHRMCMVSHARYYAFLQVNEGRITFNPFWSQPIGDRYPQLVKQPA